MKLTNEYEIIYSVNEQHLQNIEQWLSNEKNKKVHGFYNHWNIIISKQKINRMMCLKIKDSIAGFVTWTDDFNSPLQKIEYMAIPDELQGRGYGHILFNECSKHFIKNGIKAVNLRSISIQSDAFWTKMGFRKYPKEYNSNQLHYKFLVKSQKSTSKPETDETIEIWPIRFWEEKTPPTFIFEIKYIQGTNILERPIIILCHDDWRIRWRNKDKIYKDSLIKRFYKEDFVDFDEILIIDRLKRKS